MMTMSGAICINNVESPFTELFTILKKHDIQQGKIALAYDSDELQAMHQHIDNATDILLKGLQDIGGVIGFLSLKNQISIKEIGNICFFISAISNLTEALNILRSDAGYVLKLRGHMD